MPFVVMSTVRIDDVDSAREALHSQVIPGVKQSPGFVRGIWSADREGGRGIGLVIFETREQAEAQLERQRSGEMKPPDGVTFEHAAVLEVQGEA
jgi:hypothetical protein